MTDQACPFCGSGNTRVKHSKNWGWFVSCECGAVGPSSRSRDEAVAAWNRRVVAMQPSLFEDIDLSEVSAWIADGFELASGRIAAVRFGDVRYVRAGKEMADGLLERTPRHGAAG